MATLPVPGLASPNFYNCRSQVRSRTSDMEPEHQPICNGPARLLRRLAGSCLHSLTFELEDAVLYYYAGPVR